MLSAVLASLAFPPVDISVLAWFAWVPWFLALSRGPSPWVGALSGALHFALVQVLTCSWILTVLVDHAGMSWLLAAGSLVVSGLLFTPYGLILGWTGAVLCRRHGPVGALGLVALWPVVDALRTRLSLGFAWPIPGMSQATWPTALGVADLGGVHAVTWLVLISNLGLACLVLGWVPRQPGVPVSVSARWVAPSCLVLVGLGLLYGVRGEAAHGPPEAARMTTVIPWVEAAELSDELPDWPSATGFVRVAVVQGALPGEVALSPRRADEDAKARLQLALTERALVAGAELVVWSESAYPGSLGAPDCLRDLSRLLQLAAERGTVAPQAVFGGLVGESPPEGVAVRYTNSALLVDEDGLLDRYDKRHLVPFGEYLPWPEVFFWVRKLVPTDLLRGGESMPLAGDRGKLGVSVCYEMVLPQHVRALVAEGAEVLLNLTNDGWFQGSAAPEQHLRFSVLRAVENRRWVVRSANSGISAIVAPDGRVLGRIPEGDRGVLLASVAPRSALTVYSRLGDRPLAVAGLLVAAWLMAVPRRGSGGTKQGAPSVEESVDASTA